MILVTGPTGSGKTVSLYTGLNILNTTDINISTAEDPVEINLEGINQVNVNPRQGMDFSQALRAFLRQDPDVIMVGEIRDLETAEIAIKAAQTGHMVMSTLHQQRRRDPDPVAEHGRAGVQPGDLGEPDHRPAPCAKTLFALQERTRGAEGNPASRGLPGRQDRHLQALFAGGLRPLQERLQGAVSVFMK